MSFEQKKQRAIAILHGKKMWRSSYAPPLLRVLWRFGVRLPPLPFASFWQVALLMGLFFGPVWGVLMWFFSWKNSGMSLPVAAGVSALAGVLFGVLMAGYQVRRKKANKLPDWKSLG